MNWDYSLPLAILFAVGVLTLALTALMMLSVSYQTICRKEVPDPDNWYGGTKVITRPVEATIYWLAFITTIVLGTGYLT